MKKLILLFLFSPFSQAAVFSDAELKANFQTANLTCAQYDYVDYAGETQYTSNAEFGYTNTGIGYASEFHAARYGYIDNVRVGFAATNNISNFTLANGSVVRRTIGGGAISMLKGINIFEAGVLKVHLPVTTMWGTSTSNYRLSNGQVQVYSANTGIPDVTAQFVDYLWRDDSHTLWYGRGYLKISKAGKNYFLTCFERNLLY